MNIQKSLVENPDAKCELRRANLFIVGDSAAGKTSVLRWLRRRPFRAEHYSTDGADVISVVDLEDWDESGFSLQNTMASITTSSPTTTNKEEHITQPITLEDRTKGEPMSSQDHKERDKSEETIDETKQQQIAQPFIKMYQLPANEWAEIEERKKQKTVFHVWDFGGQEVYYHTHHIFFSNNAIYLLVVDVSKNNYLERMSFWMESIWGYSSHAQNNNIVIVANHTDKLSRKDVENRKQQIVSQIEKVLRSIKKQSAIPNARDVMIVSCKDGTCNGTASIEALKEWLMQKSTQLSEKKEYSARSVVLLDYLTDNSDKIQNNRKITWIDLKEVITQGKKFKLTEDETMEALRWYHELRFVFHWNESSSELRNKVYLKPEELVNAFKTIISFRHNDLIDNALKSLYSTISQHHRIPLEEGKVSNQILDRLWFEFEQDEAEREALKELFVKFGLAIKRDDELVFPCLVKRSLPELKPMDGYLNYSQFVMDEVIGPLGFTARLVQHLIEAIEKRWARVAHEIYSNGVIVLVERRLKVRVKVAKEKSHTAAATVETIEIWSQLTTPKTGGWSVEEKEKEMEAVWEVMKMIEEFAKSSKSVIATLTSTCLECFQQKELKRPMKKSFDLSCICEPPQGNK